MPVSKTSPSTRHFLFVSILASIKHGCISFFGPVVSYAQRDNVHKFRNRIKGICIVYVMVVCGKSGNKYPVCRGSVCRAYTWDNDICSLNVYICIHVLPVGHKTLIMVDINHQFDIVDSITDNLVLTLHETRPNHAIQHVPPPSLTQHVDQWSQKVAKLLSWKKNYKTNIYLHYESVGWIETVHVSSTKRKHRATGHFRPLIFNCRTFETVRTWRRQLRRVEPPPSTQHQSRTAARPRYDPSTPRCDEQRELPRHVRVAISDTPN